MMPPCWIARCTPSRCVSARTTPVLRPSRAQVRAAVAPSLRRDVRMHSVTRFDDVLHCAAGSADCWTFECTA